MQTASALPGRAPRWRRDSTLMSAADASWLRMDRPNNRMVITALMIMSEPLTRERARELIVRVAKHPRFRQPLRRHRWEVERAAPFDLEAHMRTAPVPEPVDEPGLRAWLGRLMEQPLDLSRPAWEAYVVERYQRGSAIVFRLHHSLADGMALMRVLMSAVDSPAQVEKVKLPMHGRGSLRGTRLVEGVVASLARLVFLPRDRRSALKGELSGVKHVAWSAPIPLDQVKRAGAPDGATINDVLTSALAGGLSRYFAERGEGRIPRSVRAIVPYDLRAGATDETLGNRFGLIFLTLPTGSMAPRARLQRVKRRIDRLKRTPEAWVAYGLLELIGRLSSLLASGAIWLFGRKGSVVLTNVAGPRERVTIGGVGLEDLVFWVPQAGGVGVGLSFFSYAGSVRLGVTSDARRVPEPQELVDAFVSELESLAPA